MAELRKDYLLDRYVIISNERAKRPHQFRKEQTEEINDSETDFFAPGNEKMTPPEIYRYPEESDVWNIRVFPNKFPAVNKQGNPDIRIADTFFTYSDAFGNHEVIVETPDIYKQLVDLSVQEISTVLKVLNNRIESNLKEGGVKYVSVFKNQGRDAGTSVLHTHFQLVSYNLVPRVVLEKESAIKKLGYEAYGKIISIETRSDRRCFDNKTMTAFTPYASRFPFELWIFPKRHVLRLNDLEEDEFFDMADLLRMALLKLKELNADYNLYFHYGLENMRLHLIICPRLSKWAGFEHATGTIINSMPPEGAAEFYRK